MVIKDAVCIFFGLVCAVMWGLYIHYSISQWDIFVM